MNQIAWYPICRQTSQLFLRRGVQQSQRNVQYSHHKNLQKALLQRTIASATRMLLEKRTMKVPTMGDSITEGTVIEWTVQPGQAVQVDDVVAMVETDKVTVEIKAETAGVMTQQFYKVDETAEVGSPLYEIDTEAEATVDATANNSKESDHETTNTPSSAAVSSENATTTTQSTDGQDRSNEAEPEKSHRKPLIQFLGKEGWAQKLQFGESRSNEGTSAPSETVVIPPMYGRPAFSEDEMEALMLGGASIEIPGYSSVFK